MKIKKNSLSVLRHITILGWLLPLPTLGQASPSTLSNPLQYYDDQIKKAQKEALDSLATSMAATAESTQSLPSSPTLSTQPENTRRALPSNNTDKAFALPSNPTTCQEEGRYTPPPAPTAANPWLKPNPWAEQAKHNPWANTPIPQPGAPGFTPPPNIFTPPNAANPKNSNPNHG